MNKHSYVVTIKTSEPVKSRVVANRIREMLTDIAVQDFIVVEKVTVVGVGER